MKWVWHQRSGTMTRDGQPFASGYAGRGVGKNNPDMQAVKGVGPLPAGSYRMTAMRYSAHTGPGTIVLEPLATNEMHGRGDFRIHGDSKSHPGEASDGCIIIDRHSRDMMFQPGNILLVVA